MREDFANLLESAFIKRGDKYRLINPAEFVRRTADILSNDPSSVNEFIEFMMEHTTRDDIRLLNEILDDAVSEFCVSLDGKSDMDKRRIVADYILKLYEECTRNKNMYKGYLSAINSSLISNEEEEKFVKDVNEVFIKDYLIIDNEHNEDFTITLLCMEMEFKNDPTYVMKHKDDKYFILNPKDYYKWREDHGKVEK